MSTLPRCANRLELISSLLCKRQVPEKRFRFYLPVTPVSRRHGRCLSCGIDSDDALAGNERFDEHNRLAVVIFVDDGSYKW